MSTDNVETTAKKSSVLNLSRRGFLIAGAAIGGGLLIKFSLPTMFGPSIPLADAETEVFSPNAFIGINRAGEVSLVMPYVEMGQGTYTAIPMLIAEELEVDIKTVKLEHAPANAKLYSNPLLGSQTTGGSTTIRAAWQPMREAGAVARTLLIAAAAAQWQVTPASCHAEMGSVIHAASGRKLAYGELVDAAAKLPLPAADAIKLKSPADFKLIGTAAKRLDSPDKVNGAAKYGIDVQIPDMKIAAIATSPVFGGRLKNVDDSKALKVKGVRQIVRLDDGVAVIADHMGAAKKGLAALSIEWDEGEFAKLSSADIIQSMQSASKAKGAVARADGDFAKAMAGAAQQVEAVYQVPFLAHAALEPMNCTVHLTKELCEIWVGTQVIGSAQAIAAKVTGLPLEKVIVHNFLIGGGFGRRLEVDGVERAVRIAQQVHSPVKVVWSREEDIQHDMYRPYFYDRMAAGLDKAGMPVAWNHRITGSSIMARVAPALFKDGFDPETIEGAAMPPYDLPNLLVDVIRHEPPGIPTAFWRGVGPTHNIFMVESFIDELAVAAKQDPLKYRLALLDKNPRAKAVLQLAAEKAGWATKPAKGIGRGLSLQMVWGSFVAQVVELEVATDGAVKVHKVVCAVDCGIVVNPDTVQAQIEGGILFGITAALYGNISLKPGRVEHSNFHDYKMLRMNETPLIETHIVKSLEAPGGIGEPGTSALAPALTNAIFAASGKRVRTLPVNSASLKTA
jgi:CO/xanthine dehydrogenase Mo-binding subunit